MKRWARRNLPTVVLLAALILLAALVLAIAMPRETENTPVVSAAISPTFDEAAYQSRLEVEAYAEVEHETADIPGTYDLPEPPQEADSEPCGKGGFVDAQAIMNMVENAWGGFGSAFGPVVILSLFWRRFTYRGAIAGVVGGALVDVLWYSFLSASTGIYELLPGFIAGMLCAVVATLLDKAPAKEITDIYDKATMLLKED